MGIFVLYKLIVGENLNYFTAFPLTLTVILFIYFLFIHSKFGKRNKIPFVAVVFEFLLNGLGFSYIRQPILAVLSWATMYLFVVSQFKNENSSTFMLLICLIIIFILPFIAAKLASKADAKMRREKLIHTNKVKAKGLLEMATDSATFAVDTNILMHEPTLILDVATKKNIKIVMCKTIFHELDGLKKSNNYETRTRAQLAFNVIEALQEINSIDIGYFDNFVSQKNLNGDEKIIATYIALKKTKYPNLIFLSNDKGARIIAREANLPVIDLRAFT